MSTAAARSSRRPAAAGRTDPGPGVWITLAAALLAVAAVVAWWLGWLSFGTDPRVAEIQRMQEEAQRQFSANGGPSTVVEAMAAVTTMNTIRAQVEALPPHLREQVERRGSSMFQSAMRARIDAYYQAPPEQRQAILDRQIDQEEIMRKAFEAGRAVANAAGGGGGSGGGGGGGGGPPRNGSQDDRNRWRKNMIDRSTPQQRARFNEFFGAMERRMQERGMQPGGGPRR